MSKPKNETESKNIYQVQFIYLPLSKPSEDISTEEVLERMRSFPERAAKFLQWWKSEGKFSKGDLSSFRRYLAARENTGEPS